MVVSIKTCNDKGGSSSSSSTTVSSLMTLNGKSSRRGIHYWTIFLATIVSSILHSMTFLGLFQRSERNQFTTEPNIQRTEPGLHIILSHCREPIDWIFDDEHTSVDHGVNITLKSVTIISKCGNPPFLDPNLRFPNETRVDILRLPNVGRCDHSYAYWIEKMLEDRRKNELMKQWYHPKDLILFTKDSAQKHENRRSLERMMNGTQLRGFFCGAKPFVPRGRNLVVKDILGKFKVDNYGPAVESTPFISAIRPMWAWVETLPVNISYTTFGFVDVCFSGLFMSTLQQIVDAPVTNWSTIVEALSRGDNIEEGHYMERLWAGLLAPPLSSKEVEQLIGQIAIKTEWQGVIIMKNGMVNEDDK